MKMLKLSRGMLAGILFAPMCLVAAQAGSSYAEEPKIFKPGGSIYTPEIIISGGTQAICIANNVHTAPVTVVVKIFSSVIQDTSKTCTLAIEDDLGCVHERVLADTQRVRCQISMSNLTNAEVRTRIRGVLFYRFQGSVDPRPLFGVEAD